MKHGTESGYARGCRCGSCKEARRDYRRVQRARVKALDVEVERIKANLTPVRPQDWEIERDLRRECDALRLRVAELEGQIDRMVDAALDNAFAVPAAEKKKRGRPRKVPR